MKGLNNVLWAEGIFLGPQHFQAWDRYQFESQASRQRMLYPHAWGIAELEWDNKALLNGRLDLVRLKAIFPDGRLVDFQASSQHRVTMDLSNLKAAQLTIAITLPRNEQAQGITGYPTNGQRSGLLTSYQDVADTHDVNRIREVAFTAPNISLMPLPDISDDMSALPITELTLGEDQQYQHVDECILPSLSLSATNGLPSLVKGLLEVLDHRQRQYIEQRSQLSEVANFSTAELADFLLNKDLSLARMELGQFQQFPKQHPYLLFLTLLRLHTVLAHYMDATQLNLTLAYNHESPADGFHRLHNSIRTLLNVQKQRPEAGITLTLGHNGGYYTSEINNTALERCHFYLGVNHPDDNPDWITRFPAMCKVGATSQIDTMLSSALPGVSISHCQRVPHKVRIKSGYEYFRLDTQSPLWTNIKQDRALSIFCLGDFAETQIELLVIEE